MIVEIPMGSANKVEYDGELGLFRSGSLAVLADALSGDYGFVPGTLAEDGDPLDVSTLVSEASFTGCLIEVRPIGVLNMMDREEGDQKIIAVPTRNPRYDQIHTMDQVFPHVRRELEHFFSIYKELEGRVATTQGWGGPREARRDILGVARALPGDASREGTRRCHRPTWRNHWSPRRSRSFGFTVMTWYMPFRFAIMSRKNSRMASRSSFRVAGPASRV